MKKPILIISVVSIIFNVSCLKIAGVSKFRNVEQQEIDQTLFDNGIDSSKAGFLNAPRYRIFLKEFADTNHTLKSNLSQPLQVLMFKNDTCIAHLINCYVGGFPKVHWNRYGNFDKFPLQSFPFYAPVKSPRFSEYQKTISFKNVQNSEYKMIVIWSKFLGQNNTRLLNIAKSYAEKNHLSQIYYVNFDTFINTSE